MAETVTEAPPEAPPAPAEGEGTGEGSAPAPQGLTSQGPTSYSFNDDGKLIATDAAGTETDVTPEPEGTGDAPPPEGEGEGEGGEQPKPAAEKPTEKAPEPPGSLDDATLAKMLDDPEFVERLAQQVPIQERIDRLVANRVGNHAQAQREREAAEKLFEARTAEFNKLNTDDSFYDQMVKEHPDGEAGVLEWRAGYLREVKAREAAPADGGGASTEAGWQQMANEFNDAALTEFRAVLDKVSIKEQMPTSYHETLSGLKPDGENWFNDGLTAFVKGVDDHIKALQRQHEKDLDEARESGHNEAAAARESGQSLRVNGASNGHFDDPRAIISEWAYEGRTGPNRLSPADIERARRQLGEDY